LGNSFCGHQILAGHDVIQGYAEIELTDAERHKRFVDMAREVGASDDPKAFDRAFKKVVDKPKARKAAS
jgi:hypothetical protein